MSPLLAKEIVYRATGAVQTKVRDTDSASLYAAFQTLVQPLLNRQWQPGSGSLHRVPEDFSAFPLTHLDWTACDTLSAAITGYFGAITGIDAYNEAKKPVHAAIEEAKAKLKAKLASLRQGLREDSELERLKQSGELILAYQYALEDGQRELRAQYDLDAPELVVKLKPDLDPLENAKDYFRRYEKAKSAIKAVPALIDETQLELDFVDQLETDLMSAVNWPEIDDVIQIMQTRGHWQGAHRKRMGGGGRQGPLRVVSRDGYVVWVGTEQPSERAGHFQNGQWARYLASRPGSARRARCHPQ